MNDKGSIKFLKDFKFGVADADLQVIGEDYTQKFEQSQPTMWEYFAKNSGKCFQNQTPGLGIDRYHLWEKDIELMKKMDVKHYRTSVSMSRLFRENGEVNQEALKWYSNFFQALKKAGLKLYVTIYHWELPQYLSEQGGWKNRKTIDYLVKHAMVVAEKLGKYIDEYFILNEPWHSTFLGYHLGIFAPGETSLKGSLAACHHQLLAQGLVYETISKIHPQAKISTVYCIFPIYALTDNPQDIYAAKLANGYYNEWLIDPIFTGKYPDYMIDIYKKYLPKISKEDMKIIKIGDKLHALGINYYHGKIAKYSESRDVKFESIELDKGLKNDLNWMVFLPPEYPKGLYDALVQIFNSYKRFGLRRIYITENGTAIKVKDDDDFRIFYLKEHFKQIHEAILFGVPIEAYFGWTFMDNYEWIEGYRPEAAFGFVHVDRKTMKRTPKKSFYWYKKLVDTYILPY